MQTETQRKISDLFRRKFGFKVPDGFDVDQLRNTPEYKELKKLSQEIQDFSDESFSTVKKSIALILRISALLSSTYARIDPRLSSSIPWIWKK